MSLYQSVSTIYIGGEVKAEVVRFGWFGVLVCLIYGCWFACPQSFELAAAECTNVIY